MLQRVVSDPDTQSPPAPSPSAEERKLYMQTAGVCFHVHLHYYYIDWARALIWKDLMSSSRRGFWHDTQQEEWSKVVIDHCFPGKDSLGSYYTKNEAEAARRARCEKILVHSDSSTLVFLLKGAFCIPMCWQTIHLCRHRDINIPTH